MKHTTGMMKKFGSAVVTAAMGMSLTMAATGCIFTTDDGDDDGRELSVSWSFKNIDTAVACPQGDFNVVVYTWPVGSSESALEGVAYNCSAGTGLSAFVSGQTDVWIELIDSTNQALYARSKTERIDANSVGSVAFATQLDYGFYQLNWGLFAAIGEEPMAAVTCDGAAELDPEFDSIEIFATYIDANDTAQESTKTDYDCEAGLAPNVFYTEPMPFAVRDLKVIGQTSGDDAVGVGGCINDEDSSYLGFAYGNEIVDVGLLLVNVNPEDEGGGAFCYNNERP